MTPEVIKKNKRLYIRVRETGELYYTPPDFIRKKIQSREIMVDLCNELSYIPYQDWFNVIFEFEGKMNKGRLV